ncbi:MAG: hypothetical protein Q8Q13_03220 [bacterium]|nr:hypothetical protein [bacterium]
MNERIRIEGRRSKNQQDKLALDPEPELQIVERTPDVEHMPADIREKDIGGFLNEQGRIDEQKRDKDKPKLNS